MRFRSFYRKKNSERGASLVEYGLLVALIAVVAISAVSDVGTKTQCSYRKAASAFTSAVLSSCGSEVFP